MHCFIKALLFYEKYSNDNYKHVTIDWFDIIIIIKERLDRLMSCKKWIVWSRIIGN